MKQGQRTELDSLCFECNWTFAELGEYDRVNLPNSNAF